MKQILLAFILSISLHLLAIYSIKEVKPIAQEPKAASKDVKKTDVRFVRLIAPVVKAKKVEPVKKTKPIKKPQPKKVVKKKPVIKKTELKKVKKIVKQEKRKTIPKPTVENYKAQKKLPPKVEKPYYETMNPTKLQKQTLDEFLATPVLEMDELDKLTRENLELYEEEYNNLTKVQKVFLQNNLRNFQIITQKVLNRMGYPRMAAKLNLGGVNVVEFMFHPDGSISELKITSSSGYDIFDKYTLELIEIAYKDYPRPVEPTKIKFYVRYLNR